MDLGIAREALKEVGEYLKDRHSNIACYLFGSYLTNPIEADDIDLLFIYADQDAVVAIRAAFGDLAPGFPWHLHFMTAQEEREFDFIKGQNAILLFSC